jgi:hypothetical protein
MPVLTYASASLAGVPASDVPGSLGEFGFAVAVRPGAEGHEARVQRPGSADEDITMLIAYERGTIDRSALDDELAVAGPGGSAVPGQNPATASHVVAVPLHPSITVGVIALAVILSVAGGLMAGLAASWRIASLRPADALAQVA